MSGKSTTRLIEMYLEEASAPMFLSGFFQSPPRNFHNTEKVEIDIVRDDEDVAVVVTDLSTGARANELSLYTNKGFTPPILWEKGGLNSFNQIHRVAGQDPFEDPEFGANAVAESFRMYRQLEQKVRRTIEQMASQVLQGGVLTLTDSGGNTLYTLDFGARSAQHATVSTAWAADGSTGSPLVDLEDLAVLVRRNGKKNPNKLIFGKTAWRRFKENADVQAAFNKDQFNLGALAPETRGEGATYQGRVWLGHYMFEMWTYDAYYKDPSSGSLVPYVDDEKVIMMSDGRLDLTYGAIPRIVAPDPRVQAFLPGRIASSSAGLDLNPWASVSPDGTHVEVEVGTRPLTIPTAIDTFASLDVAA